MIRLLRNWRITWRGYSFGPGRYTWPDKHGRHVRDHLHAIDHAYPDQPVREAAWKQFVRDHEWPGTCPNCVWWVPSPAEAEDAIAVYRPCALHDPALWPEQEKKAE